MHVATTARTYHGKVYVSHLLRRSFREGGKVRHQTLGNLSHLPPDLIDTIRRRLAGETSADRGPWEIVRSLPHGHVAAVLGTVRQIGLEGVLASRPSRERSLVIAEEAALDGLYVIRTSVEEAALSSENTVRAYKDLAQVERAFRSMKTIDLHVRPIYHWLDERIKAHGFLCMLSYYGEWHMRKRLAAVLFDDHDKQSAEASRKSIVAPAPRSQAAKRKDLTKRTEADEPVHSFRSLLADLGTLCKNRVRLLSDSSAEFYLLTRPTPPQQQALGLLGVEVPL